jgi:hypothetical protein
MPFWRGTLKSLSTLRDAISGNPVLGLSAAQRVTSYARLACLARFKGNERVLHPPAPTSTLSSSLTETSASSNVPD